MASRADRFTKDDLWYSGDGDLVVGGDGDLRDTSDDKSRTRALIQEIQQVLSSSTGDWKSNPTFAADLAEFIGEIANDAAGDRIARRIKEKLVRMGIVSSGQLDIIPLILGSTALFRITVTTGLHTSEVNMGYDSDNKRFRGY